MNETETEELD